jgi:hypothetical protein
LQQQIKYFKVPMFDRHHEKGRIVCPGDTSFKKVNNYNNMGGKGTVKVFGYLNTGSYREHLASTHAGFAARQSATTMRQLVAIPTATISPKSRRQVTESLDSMRAAAAACKNGGEQEEKLDDKRNKHGWNAINILHGCHRTLLVARVCCKSR